MSTDIAVRETVSHAGWTNEQRTLIRQTFAGGATDGEFAALLAVAEARNLNPFTKQVHFVKRWDSQKRCETWAVQVSIDGLRAIAERTGLYAGQDEPEYEYEDNGSIRLCKVRVYRKDWGGRAAVGVAHWREYVQLSREGKPTAMWSKYAHIMIAKCAEALALRKAFPEAASGLYTTDEYPVEQAQRVEVVRADEDQREPAAIDRELAEAQAEAKYQGGPPAPQAPAAEGRDPRTAPSFVALLDSLEQARSTDDVVAAWLAHGARLAQDGSDVLAVGRADTLAAWTANGGAPDESDLRRAIEAARAAKHAAPPADEKPRSKARRTQTAPLARTIEELPTVDQWRSRVGLDSDAGHIAGGYHKRREAWRAAGSLGQIRGATVDRLCTLLATDESGASRWLDGCDPDSRRTERRAAETDRRRAQ